MARQKALMVFDNDSQRNIYAFCDLRFTLGFNARHENIAISIMTRVLIRLLIQYYCRVQVNLQYGSVPLPLTRQAGCLGMKQLLHPKKETEPLCHDLIYTWRELNWDTFHKDCQLPLLFSVYLSRNWSVGLSVCLSISLSACLSVSQSVRQPRFKLSVILLVS